MKRRTIALLLALAMCLSLLSACGANNAPETSEPPSSESTAQQPAESEKPEESEESREEGPEESGEPTEEGPEESEEPTEPENNAGTEFLALLQEEWNNGFVQGEGPRRTYYTPLVSYGRSLFFIRDGVVYLWEYSSHGDIYITVYSYNIATKESGENYVGPSVSFVLNDTVYCRLGTEIYEFDYNGTLRETLELDEFNGSYLCFEKGILVGDEKSKAVYSYDFEKIADIPTPQVEVEHGLKKDVSYEQWLVADGTVYVSALCNDAPRRFYRLDTDTYEWEETDDIPDVGSTRFVGKYVTGNGGIYDRVTGEQVFEYGELYPPAITVNLSSGSSLCYFGGDKYLGYQNREYRWVNLTDMSMSDPLPFPENKECYILNDTYCVYRDSYGWFLWNYTTGEEETIVMFNQ